MKKLLLIALALTPLIPANATLFTLDLLGRSGPGLRFDNENPTASGTATGNEFGSGLLYDDAINQLTVNVRWGSINGFTDLTGTATNAHIHDAGSALFTASGGVAVGLTGTGYSSSATSGGWTNTQVTLTAPQETALFNGFLYINVHTAANGGGEIRGNLVNPVAVPEPSVAGLLALSAGGMLFRRRRA